MYLFQPKLLVGESLACLRELQALLASRFPSVLLVFAAHRELLGKTEHRQGTLHHSTTPFRLPVPSALRSLCASVFTICRCSASTGNEEQRTKNEEPLDHPTIESLMDGILAEGCECVTWAGTFAP